MSDVDVWRPLPEPNECCSSQSAASGKSTGEPRRTSLDNRVRSTCCRFLEYELRADLSAQLWSPQSTLRRRSFPADLFRVRLITSDKPL